MTDRTIVLIPASDTDAESVYWQNFVWRVQDMLRRDQLSARVVVATAPKGRDA